MGRFADPVALPFAGPRRDHRGPHLIAARDPIVRRSNWLLFSNEVLGELLANRRLSTNGLLESDDQDSARRSRNNGATLIFRNHFRWDVTRKLATSTGLRRMALIPDGVSAGTRVDRQHE